MAPRGERTHLRSPTAKEQAVPAPEAPPAAPPVWDAVFVLPKTAEWEPAAAEESGDIELGSMREKDFQDIGEAKMFRRLLRRLTASGVEYRCYASIQRDEVYVRVRCPEARVAAQADIRNFAIQPSVRGYDRVVHQFPRDWAFVLGGLLLQGLLAEPRPLRLGRVALAAVGLRHRFRL